MQTVLITGAGQGLGKGFVDYLLKENFLVFAGVRKPSVINQNRFQRSKDRSSLFLAKDLARNKNLKVFELDVTNDESIDKAFTLIREKTDHLDLLINNAGINKDTATNNHKELVCNLKDLNRETLLKMFDVNAVSPMIILKRFLPLMKNDPSFVINISSNRASYGDNTNTSGNYGYRASKIALNMMTLSSLFNLPSNVKTFAVHPGDVKSAMNPEGSDLPFNQARKIISITKKWKEEFNGKFLKPDGTLYPY